MLTKNILNVYKNCVSGDNSYGVTELQFILTKEAEVQPHRVSF